MEDITAPYATAELQTAVPLRVRLRLSVAAKSDMGRVREHNEDKFEFFMPDEEPVLARRGLAFLVCDGMGGHASGQIASELTCKTFLRTYYDHPSHEVEQALRDAVTASDRLVFRTGQSIPSRKGMGTTLSALVLLQDEALIAQVGDSRIYLWRGGSLQQCTTDHTWVEDVVSQGLMSREEAENHPYRHVITRAIGTQGDAVPDVFRFPIQAGDVFLLCSDGLNNHVPDAKLHDLLSQYGLADAAWEMVQAALLDGGSDNCTVLLVRVDAMEAVEGS